MEHALPAAVIPESPRATTGWLALLAGLAVVAATLGLWQALTAQERAATERAVNLNLEAVNNEIGSRIDSRVLALTRMARRWSLRGRPPRAEWESDARLYLSHYAGHAAIARLEPDLRAGWVLAREPVSERDILQLVAGRNQEALQSARLRRDVRLASSLDPVTGNRLLLVCVPVFRGEDFDGFIVGVFGAQPMLEAILLPSLAQHYSVAVLDDEAEIFRRGGGTESSAADWGQERTVSLHGLEWRVRVWPQEELLERRSPLPGAVLAGGLSLALLIALTVRLAQVARLRARETESVNLELKGVVARHQQVNERLRKLSRAVEQSPSMVLITDNLGAIEYINPRFSQVTGYTLEEISGKNPRFLKSGETDPAQYRHLWQTITAGNEWRGVLHDRKKNGDLFWVHSAISPIRDAEGAIAHFLAEMEDVTEHRRLEQQVAEHNREIAKSQALAAMGQAASMIAHDLRNPLSTIKMGLQILGKKLPPDRTEEEKELLQISQEQVRYMEEVLSDLLSYSAPDALKPEWLSVDKLLDTALMLSQKPVEEHGVRVNTRYPPGLPVLYGDANKLRQVFTNLIVNAAQATSGGEKAPPTIVIDARLRLPAGDSPSIQIEICDNGCGVAPEHLDKVFEPFFTTRAQGTGLGLPIARRIVEQHQGSISLQPEVPRGTRVTVVLPLAPAHGRNGS